MSCSTRSAADALTTAAVVQRQVRAALLRTTTGHLRCPRARCAWDAVVAVPFGLFVRVRVHCPGVRALSTGGLTHGPACGCSVGVLMAVSVAPPVGLAIGPPVATADFLCTGSEQSRDVPVGVTSVDVVAIGARGGTGNSREGRWCWCGAFRYGPGRSWSAVVGRSRLRGVRGERARGAGGFNGGGAGVLAPREHRRRWWWGVGRAHGRTVGCRIA